MMKKDAFITVHKAIDDVMIARSFVSKASLHAALADNEGAEDDPEMKDILEELFAVEKQLTKIKEMLNNKSDKYLNS